MAVVTRPEDVPENIVTPDDRPFGAADPMSVRLANCLVTQAPMTVGQLHTVRTHFWNLVKALDVSGPMFAPMRRQAIDMHNRAVRRINGVKEDERRRMEELKDERLLEIER
jgi:hypothetical protein